MVTFWGTGGQDVNMGVLGGHSAAHANALLGNGW